jgi:hypothetical protein
MGLSTPADTSKEYGGARKEQTDKHKRFPERRKADHKHCPPGIGFDEGKDLSHEMVHGAAGAVTGRKTPIFQ